MGDQVLFLLIMSIITASLLVIVEVFYRTRNKIMTSAHEKDTSSSPASDDDGVASSSLAVCYLCLDGGADEADQPLRRDCACRGTDAGFVHLSCLTEYLATKNKGSCTISEIIKPWEVCPNCLQEYRNELAVDIVRPRDVSTRYANAGGCSVFETACTQIHVREIYTRANERV